MPYPAQFPYELLDASPTDNLPILMKRWQQALMKRRQQAVEVRHAFDELKDIRTRLSYDILLITDATTSDQASKMINQLDTKIEIPTQIPSPTIDLAMTDVFADPSDLYKPIHPRTVPIGVIKRFAEMPTDIIKVHFDKQ